jgi:LysR family cyn operon transcriptional activator
MVDRYLRRTGAHPHVAVEANSIAAIVEMVRVAGLATILPETVAQEQTGLRVVPLTPAIDSRRVAMLQRRGGYRSAASRAFITVAQDHARTLEDEPKRGVTPSSSVRSAP